MIDHSVHAWAYVTPRADPPGWDLASGEVLSDLYGLAGSRLGGEQRRQLRSQLYLDVQRRQRRLWPSDPEA